MLKSSKINENSIIEYYLVDKFIFVIVRCDLRSLMATRNFITSSCRLVDHSPPEGQAAILRPVTQRLLLNVKIGPGMRVLDLGCGLGDVSMLAAEFVGPTGLVVGIDRNREVLSLARERARAAGLRQISFAQGEVESFSSQEPFDLVIGRCILVHQSDPVDFLRAAECLVSPGGVIAFHEFRSHQRFDSLPTVPLWQVTGDLIRMAFRSALPHCDVSDQLIELFPKAGLSEPNLFCETLVGGGVDSPLYAWAAETLESLLPQLTKMGIRASLCVGQDLSTIGIAAV
jgi:SAM-dependent methyltransferase